ncbi:MAG TPA: metal-dependent hydrolase [Balneolaceae bacterium]|nr:metal-dependent hydrolase [Balneolaceae bacterium]
MKTSVKAHWLGHSAFYLQSPNGKHILIDPFLKDNPSTPDDWKEPGDVDYIFLTHGHADHVGDTVEIAERTGCKVISILELSTVLTTKHGLDEDQAAGFNKGGTISFDDFSVTMVSANHSSSFQGDYTGEPAGLIFSFDDDISIYHLGDTNIFSDLELYGDLYQPEVTLVPMGDHFTMGPEEATWAVDMLRPEIAIPIHYGTMPVLSGDPEEFKALVEEETDTEVLIPEAGENFLQ